MVRVSIIVPCYNVGKFLPECLDCLVQQTLHDIEIICIDDKSNDNTRAIMHEFAEQDSRIHVIEFNKNRGVAAARNAGIDMARGEYIGFVDPDDTVDKDFFAVLYKLATDNHADIAKGIAKMVDTNGATSVLNSNDEIRTAKYNFCTCFWTAIYRREFLNQNNIRFPDGLIVSEDLVFLIKSVHFANMVATTDDVSYMYIRHDDSADSAAFSTCKIDSGVSAIQQLIQWGNTQPDMYTDEYNNLVRRVMDMAAYLSGKTMSQPDKEKTCDLILWLYSNIRDSQYILQIAHHNLARAIKKQNPSAIYRALFVKNIRFKLFGFIPMLKISVLDGCDMRLLLFDLIPIINVQSRGRKNIVRLCGIPIFLTKR